MQTPTFNHEVVLDALCKNYPKSIIKSAIRGVYLFGSHVYGTASPTSSDFDFFIIQDGFIYQDEAKDIIGRDVTNDSEVLVSVKTDEGFEIDAHIYSTYNYIQLWRVYDSVPAVCLFAHDKYVWYEDPIIRDYRTYWLTKLNLYYRAIRISTHKESHLICIRKSKRLFDSNRPKSKKNIVHAIRYLMFGIQTAKYGKVVDFHCANEYYYEVMAKNHDQWETYEAEYMPVVDKLLEELVSCTKEKQDIAIAQTEYNPRVLERAYENGIYQLETLKFIESNTISAIASMFSTHIHPLPYAHRNLIKLIADEEANTSCSSTVYRECNGMVLDTSRDQYKVVSLPPFYIPILEAVENEVSLREDCTISVCHEGMHCDLFWYDGQWELTTDQDEEIWIKSLANVPQSDTCAYFWKCWESQGLMLPSEQHQRKSFHFILDLSDTILLFAVRNLDTLLEENPEIYAQEHQWTIVSNFEYEIDPSVNYYSLSLKMLEVLDISKHSGIIIRDERYRRVKIELPIYTYIKKVKYYGLHLPKRKYISAAGETYLVEILRRCTSEDMEPIIQQMVDRLNPDFSEEIRTRLVTYRNLCQYLDDWHDKHMTSTEKANTLKIKEDFPLTPIIMYKMTKMKLRAREVFSNLDKSYQMKTPAIANIIQKFVELPIQ
jgi:predicted nucleotidyltransferase